MPNEVEESRDSSKSTQKSPRLLNRFESSECRITECRTTHPPLPRPGHLMRLLGPIIRVLGFVMNNIGHQLTMSNSIADNVRWGAPSRNLWRLHVFIG
jgi:hypothetical protein